MEHLPVFKLEKWIIREFENEDIDLVRKASRDPLIPLITSIPEKFSKKSGEEYIDRQKQRHKTDKGCSFAIADIETNTAVGSIFLGLHNVDEGRALIGYWIVEDFRGNSIIRNTLPIVIEWAFNALKIPRLELYVEPWNIGSIKTAQSLGFQKEGLLRSWQEVGSERKNMFMMSLLATD